MDAETLKSVRQALNLKGNNTKRPSRFIWEIIIVFVVFVISVLFINFRSIAIDYSGNITNAKTQIPAQSVPTIINGLAASTSIIVGFSIALIGATFREVIKTQQKATEVLIGCSGAFAFCFVLLFIAYDHLMMGGEGFLELAWKNAASSLACALFLLLFIFLFVAYAQEKTSEINFDKCANY
jgi:cytochrome bd-type quinol oxidase subunit 2